MQYIIYRKRRSLRDGVAATPICHSAASVTTGRGSTVHPFYTGWPINMYLRKPGQVKKVVTRMLQLAVCQGVKGL